MVSALAGGLLRFFVQGEDPPQELIVLVLGRTLPVTRPTGVDEGSVFVEGLYATHMLEFLLEMLLELAGEFLLELVMAAILDLLLRAIAKVFETFRFANPVFALASYVLLGVLSGGLSVLVFPHPLVHPSRLHGINLLVSPIATGLAMSLIGSMLSRQDKKVTRIESFGYGFAFAFGIALIRYLFAS
jgi:hypothetical protein